MRDCIHAEERNRGVCKKKKKKNDRSVLGIHLIIGMCAVGRVCAFFVSLFGGLSPTITLLPTLTHITLLTDS